MEIMKKVAAQHGMVCLLHEKPFAGVNGSGKHNNWSHLHRYRRQSALARRDSPRKRPVPAVPLRRSSRRWTTIRSCCEPPWPRAGNDHRLGANEAPPAVVSIFLGDELTAVLDAIENGRRLRRRGKEENEAGRRCAAPLYPGHHGPQPHLTLRLHRQQIRVPDAGLLQLHRLRQHHAQHRGGRVAEATTRTSWSRRRTSTPPCTS